MNKPSWILACFWRGRRKVKIILYHWCLFFVEHKSQPYNECIRAALRQRLTRIMEECKPSCQVKLLNTVCYYVFDMGNWRQRSFVFEQYNTIQHVLISFKTNTISPRNSRKQNRQNQEGFSFLSFLWAKSFSDLLANSSPHHHCKLRV